MGNLTKLMCPECGGELADLGNGVYKCKGCAKTWKEKEAQNFSIYFKNFEQQLENLNTALDNQEQKRISNLKRALWKQVNAEFVSNVEVERLCKQLQAYSFEDFYANFFLATCGRNKSELGEFLQKTDVYEHFDDIPFILDYLLKALKPEWVMGVSNFIEKIKDIDTAVYHKYRTRFEDEYQKIESYVFEPTLERDVFVAYSSKDMEKVSELVSVLEEKENLSCFVAARNMRHGSGSVENYSELLHTAIDNCQVFVFVSSENSRDLKCDAFREEISYIIEKGNNKPRVEYLIQNYSGKTAERNFTKFFKGHEYCLSPKDVAERVTDILMNGGQVEEAPAKAKEPENHGDLSKKLRRVIILIEAGEFAEAKERLDKIERDEESRVGECEIAEVYHYKMLAEYAAHSDDELINKLVSKQEDISKNKNYLLAKTCAEDNNNNAELKALLSIESRVKDGIAKAENESKIKIEEERKRKIKEEEERKAREEEERKRKEAEAKAKAEAEEEERKRKEAEAKAKAEKEAKSKKEAEKLLLNIGDYKDIGGGFVTFGTYPQSKKADNVQIGEIFDKERGYYLGSDNNLYEKYNNEYYKVEPIKWKVLSNGSEQFIVSDILLDAHRFDGSSNNYANSEIRKWLNGDFYNKAFNQEQKNKIVTTNVDNSIASTGDKKNEYVCSNTSDKIFLLSHKEAEQYFTSKTVRLKKGADYAKARGLHVNSDKGNSWWWLRSPYFDRSDSVQGVHDFGGFGVIGVRNNGSGVVCALRIKPQAVGQTKAQANINDFEIKDGVLIKYKGNGGDVVIPNGVREIGDSAFKLCASLSSVTIPNSVTSIGEGAFSGCSLDCITIPESVTYVGMGAFWQCESLKTIYCRAANKPVGWFPFWNNGCKAEIVWEYNGAQTDTENEDLKLKAQRLYDEASKCYENKDYIKFHELIAQALNCDPNNAQVQNSMGLCYHYGYGVAQNYAEAVKWYRKAVEQGYASAQCNLGVCYRYGQGVTQSYTEAVKWYRKAAEQGNAYAQYNLGLCYENGQGVTQSYTEAVKWYRKAVEQGYASAQCNLGYCYEKGKGITQDYAEAVKWYRKAAEQGNVIAQCNLGSCYDSGQGVTQNYAEAVKWYRKAAEQGNAKAQNNLASYYYSGQGVMQNYAEAAKWYKKAAEQGLASAQFNLALCYAKGQGVMQDYTEAIKWYLKAADQGMAEAQLNLGNCYYSGKGATQNYTEAAKWYKKAAEQGNASAQYNLGVCYDEGQGVTQNYAEAVKWYRKAAEQGDAGAQLNLGVCYDEGKGVTQNYAEAVKWYSKAAEQGNADAQYNLGACYINGQGVMQNYAEAARWLRKAAEQGDASAQYNLGVCYDEGQGVKKDKVEAAKWYSKAAEQGNVTAQYNLGTCYENGDGVKKDKAEAAKWYNKAAEQGDEDAQLKMKKFRKYLK